MLLIKPAPVNGHCHMLILVSIHSDDNLNGTTADVTDVCCHLCLLWWMVGHRLSERTKLRWDSTSRSYEVTARLSGSWWPPRERYHSQEHLSQVLEIPGQIENPGDEQGVQILVSRRDPRALVVLLELPLVALAVEVLPVVVVKPGARLRQGHQESSKRHMVLAHFGVRPVVGVVDAPRLNSLVASDTSSLASGAEKNRLNRVTTSRVPGAGWSASMDLPRRLYGVA